MIEEISENLSKAWAAVRGAARAQCDDPQLVAVLMGEYGWSRADSEAALEDAAEEIATLRRLGEADLMRRCFEIATVHALSPAGARLLTLLAGNVLGMSTGRGSLDEAIAAERKRLENMPPAERARVLAAAAKLETR